ncbi:MAG: hypothetical protein V7782_01625 [Psychromonas sp.]
MPALKVNMPKGFKVNDVNIRWMKNYLIQKSPLIKQLTGTTEAAINNLDMQQFYDLCVIFEETADGRELKSKMFKAWRSKKSRDSDNGKKLFTFNLDIKAGVQLKKLAKNSTINSTVEALIFNTYQSQQVIKQQSKILESNQVDLDMDSSDVFEVKQLANQEKSVLIRNILKLNKQLKQYETKLKQLEQTIKD